MSAAKVNFPAIFLAPIDGNFDVVLDAMNKATQDWTMRAARGECGWICSSCGCSFPDGMPDECLHGQQSCTDIIRRDKADAKATGSAQ